jgi:hypothetical protein
LDYQISLRAGTLHINTRREELPMETLVDFASRHNPKRGFLFVSKVLGKHIPCRPSRMRQVYDRLAETLGKLPKPVVVIGMAETATGLGAGVAHSLARGTAGDDVFYLHTTRHHLDIPVLIRFDENHSHAPDYILYSPQEKRESLFRQARSLVLVDDEISTGRTLQLLAQGVASQMPQLTQLRWVSIINWLSEYRQHDLVQEFAPSLQFINLLEGEFVFEANPAFQPGSPPGLEACQPSHHARADTGRTGLLMPDDAVSLPINEIPAGPLVVVGTGEFTFAPFLTAENLEQRGHDVLFQSTTRSPILEGEAIRKKLVFNDEHDEGIVNYIYNLPRDRQVIVAYEHPAMAANHRFPELVNAHIWALKQGD